MATAVVWFQNSLKTVPIHNKYISIMLFKLYIVQSYKTMHLYACLYTSDRLQIQRLSVMTRL